MNEAARQAPRGGRLDLRLLLGDGPYVRVRVDRAARGASVAAAAPQTQDLQPA